MDNPDNNLTPHFNRLHRLDGFAVVLFPNEALVKGMIERMPVVDDFEKRTTIVVTRADFPCLPMELFRRVRVVSVPQRCLSSDEALAGAIRRGMEVQKDTMARFDEARKKGPPPVDPAAAATVAAAYANMRPLTPDERKQFLDDFYSGMGDGP